MDKFLEGNIKYEVICFVSRVILWIIKLFFFNNIDIWKLKNIIIKVNLCVNWFMIKIMGLVYLCDF